MRNGVERPARRGVNLARSFRKEAGHQRAGTGRAFDNVLNVAEARCAVRCQMAHVKGFYEV